MVEVEINPDFSRARKPTSGRATEKSGGSDNYGALRKKIDQLRSHNVGCIAPSSNLFPLDV